MNIFKSILFYILNILNIPLAAICAFGFTWFVVPTVKETIIGTKLLTVLSEQAIFWIVLGSAIAFVIFTILDLIFNWEWRSKKKNFFTHSETWLACIIIVALSIITFILTDPLVTEGISIGVTKKVSIITVLAFLVIFHIFSSKIGKIINRKIQAYDNAKEMGVVGRSSIIWVNILRLAEILFPEILILVLLCLMVSWDVSSYFVVLIVAILLPVLGNIISDFRARKEAVRDKARNEKKLINGVADKVNEE